MKKLHSALLLVLPLFIASCSNDPEEPQVERDSLKLSFVASDAAYQVYSYNDDGLVSQCEWIYQDENGSLAANSIALYEYAEDGTIAITSIEENGDFAWDFKENMHLNADGTANYVEGTAAYYTDAGRVLMKDYRAEFKYDSSRRLVAIKIVEKLTDGAGLVDKNPLEWNVELVWAKGNLTKYSEYANPARPMASVSYAYYGGEVADDKPIVQHPILRNYYTPLQYQGVLGRQSVGLVKEQTIGDGRTLNYAYNIATSSSGSRVEGYTETTSGKDSEYVVAWD